MKRKEEREKCKSVVSNRKLANARDKDQELEEVQDKDLGQEAVQDKIQE